MPDDTIDTKLDAIDYRIRVYREGQMKILARMTLEPSEELEGQNRINRLGTYIADLISVRNELSKDLSNLSKEDLQMIARAVSEVERINEQTETVKAIFAAVIAISNGWK